MEESTPAVVGKKRPRLALVVPHSTHNESDGAKRPAHAISEHAWWKPYATAAAHASSSALGAMPTTGGAAWLPAPPRPHGADGTDPLPPTSAETAFQHVPARDGNGTSDQVNGGGGGVDGVGEEGTPRTRWRAAFGGTIGRWSHLVPATPPTLGMVASNNSLATQANHDGIALPWAEEAGGRVGSRGTPSTTPTAQGGAGSRAGASGSTSPALTVPSGPSPPLPGGAAGLAHGRSHHHHGTTTSNPFSARNAPAYRYAVVHTRGRRKENEDRFAVVASFLGHRDSTMYAVFDGHGGHAAAQHAAQHLADYLEQQWREDDVAQGVVAAFLQTEAALEMQQGICTPTPSGSAAAMAVPMGATPGGHPVPPPPLGAPPVPPAVAHAPALPAMHGSGSGGRAGVRNPFATSTSIVPMAHVALEGEEGPAHRATPSSSMPPVTAAAAAPTPAASHDGTTALVCIVVGCSLVLAHVGDSRCLLIASDATLAAATQDHTTAVAEERERVLAAGFSIDADGRVQHSLTMTRSLGDVRFKPLAIPATPTVQVVGLRPHSRHMCAVLATDGVWDVLSNDDVLQIVKSSMMPLPTPSTMGATTSSHSPTLAGMGGETPPAASGPHAAVFHFPPAQHAAATATSGGGTALVSKVAVESDSTAPPSSMVLAEPGTVAARILAEAQLRGALDNITVLVVDFTRPTVASPATGAGGPPSWAVPKPAVTPGVNAHPCA